MRNQALVKSVLSELSQWGVKHIVVCPGGRNAPFVEALSSAHPFHIYTHFDERTASFFALGLAQNKNQPVVILTTSGTAVSETLSACVEATYTGTPLVVLSADRPFHYRGSASPQTIRQSELLKPYCHAVYDIQKAPLRIESWDKKSPLHVNVGFDEPLIEDDFHFSEADFPIQNKESRSLTAVEESQAQEAIDSFCSQSKSPLVVVSGSFGFPQASIKEILQNLSLPLFIECTSGLKSHPDLREKEIRFPEKMRDQVDGVIRIGHVPTHRLWRDLESKPLPVLNFNHLPFSGLSWDSKVWPYEALSLLPSFDFPSRKLEGLVEQDQRFQDQLENSLIQFPLSEPSMLRALQNHWSSKNLVYLGNSLPIREWDCVSSAHTCFSQVMANRGANGIDGQLASFLGHSVDRQEALGVFGDLTSLYDMNAPWFLKNLEASVFFAVINNAGGMIFDRLFDKELYLNRHNMSFEALAQMWGLEYQLFSPKDSPFQTSSSFIEVKPDSEQTRLFWDSMR